MATANAMANDNFDVLFVFMVYFSVILLFCWLKILEHNTPRTRKTTTDPRRYSGLHSDYAICHLKPDNGF